jgi:phenolic acid decarboxylase
MSYVGRTFLYAYEESGVRIIGRFTDETTLVWEAVEGPAKGKAGIETVDAVPVGDDLYFVSWIEEGGTAISQVLDLQDMRVTAFISYDTPGGRVGEVTGGALTDWVGPPPKA